MSLKYPVEFKLSQRSRIDKNFLDIVKRLSPFMGRNDDTPVDPIEFVFRILKGKIQNIDAPYKGKIPIQKIYLSFTTRKELDPKEHSFCQILQELIDAIDTKKNWDRVIGTLFEMIAFMDAKSRFRGDFCSPANIYVNGKKVDDTNKQLDIGIDGLDRFEELRMCECAVSLSSFTSPDKSTELKFYAKAFLEVRSVVDKNTKLHFEILAADSRGQQIEDLIPAQLAAIRKAGVSISPKIFIAGSS